MSDEATTPAAASATQKFGGFVMMAAGFALLPLAFLVAPRWVISWFREGMDGTLADPEQRGRIRFETIEKTDGDIRDDDALKIVEDLIADGDWPTLAELVADWDMAADKATNGFPLAKTASDQVVHELVEGYYEANYCTPIEIPVVNDATIEVFDLLRAKHPDLYILGLFVAHLQIMKAWEFRGTDTSDTVSEGGWEAARKRVEKAKWVLAPLIDKGLKSPMLAFMRISLLAFDCNSLADFRRPFDAHVAADPTSWLGYRWLGYYLLPRWYGEGDFAAELRAETDRLGPQYGPAAYASAYLNVAPMEQDVLLGVDAEHFARGVADLVDMHGNDQGYVNWMMRQVYQLPDEQGEPWFGARRKSWAAKSAIIRQAAFDIARRRLKLIHRGVFPDVAEALYILTKAAAEDYRAGNSFTLDGKGFRSVSND